MSKFRKDQLGEPLEKVTIGGQPDGSQPGGLVDGPSGSKGDGPSGPEDRRTEGLEADAGHQADEDAPSFGWEDGLALAIAFIQVGFIRVLIRLAAFALVIYLLGKLWLRCW